MKTAKTLIRAHWPRYFARTASIPVILIGAIVLIGWASGTASLTSVLPEWPKMAPNTAFAFVLAGVALWLVSAKAVQAPLSSADTKRKQLYKWGLFICAGLITLLGCIKLIESFTGWNSGINRLLFPLLPGVATLTTTGNLSSAVALNFFLLGLALLFSNSTQFFRVFQVFTLLALLIGWLGLTRYFYGGGVSLFPYTQMAMHTAIAFLFLSVGTLFVRTDGGLMELLTSRTIGGTLARRLLPIAMLIPPIVGWLLLQGQKAGWYETEAGVALFALSNVVIFGAVIWANAAVLNSSDIQRKQAEEKLHDQLERLNLLHHITRAIGERQDLHSICQVVVRSLEDQLPVDFCCICLYDQPSNTLTVTCIGAHSEMLAKEMMLFEQGPIPIDQNGLSRCVRGYLVYEPDIRDIAFPFPERLMKVGLHAVVFAPLLVESQVFGVLIAARRPGYSFSSGECEFIKQLSEHVALASHQAHLYTALQQAYDELRETQQGILQQERLRALGQMASGIAHDINNAISPITLYTESLLETELSLSDRARKYLTTIQRAIEDVAETVARMREFYRQREPQLLLAPVDLNRVVEQVVELTRARWNNIPQQRGIVISMETELGAHLPIIMGVESEIREALTNLIFNAVDAMPEGGILTLRTRPGTGVAGVAEDADTLYVAIEVADTGIGMDEDTRRRCLEPFYTTKGERGTGLGLAMVYGMIERHSAEIEIDSTLGKGTTVRIIFAAADSGSSLAEPALATPVPAHLRILIVDDDPLLIRSLVDILETDGHSVVTANGGQMGIDTFQSALQRKEPFGVVMTDLGMPHIDGRQVADAIKRMSASTPVIMLTGWGQRLAAEGEVPPNVDRVLSKPPKLRDLREALTSLRTDGVK